MARRLEVLFFCSGVAALLYEVAWFRMLGILFGTTLEAQTAVLAAYLGGLGLGALLGPALLGRRKPLAVYGFCEVAAACLALAGPLFLKFLEPAHAAVYNRLGSQALLFFRLGAGFLVVGFPCLFLGATLPVLVAGHPSREHGLPTSRLYAVNAAGAVVGSLAGGLLLAGYLGTRATLALAAAIAFALAAVAWRWREKFPVVEARRRLRWGPVRTVAALAVAIGFAGIVWEMLWFRMAGLLFGPSIYVIATVLAAVILGLSAAGWLAGRMKGTWREIAEALVAAGFWTWFCFALMNRLPVYAVWTGLAGAETFWPGYFLQALLIFILVTPGAAAFGLGLPLAVRLAKGREDRGCAEIYAADTLGSILGAVAAGFVLLPGIGSEATWRLLGIGAAGTGGGIFWIRRHREGAALPWLAGAVALCAVSLLWGRWDLPRLTSGPYLYAQTHGEIARERGTSLYEALDRPERRVIFAEEGRNAFVTVREDQNGIRSLQIQGKTEASTHIDRETQMLIGHLPAILHGSPRRVLVIGLGSGMTAASVLTHPGVERLDIAEIEPAVVQASVYFAEAHRHLFSDPRVRLLQEDGRTVVAGARAEYDVIIAEPSNPWIAGAVNLFTVEFFESVKRALKPDGVFCGWLPLYGLSLPEYQRALASWAAVFPRAGLWQMTFALDMVLTASLSAQAVPWSRLQTALEVPAVRRDLLSLDIRSAWDLAGRWLAQMQVFQSDLGRVKPERDEYRLLELTSPRTLGRSPIETFAWLERHMSDPGEWFAGVPASQRQRLRDSVMGMAYLRRARMLLPTEGERAYAINLEKAWRKAPDNQIIQHKWVDYHIRQMEQAISRGRWEAARAALKHMADPRLERDSRLWIARARYATFRKNYPEAQRLWQEVLRRRPQDALARRALEEVSEKTAGR